MAELAIQGVIKTYPNGHEALKGVSVTVGEGELLVVVGPSGCGKSTLLRCVAGLERITSGGLVLDGTPIAELRPDERDIAMVFQNYALYPHMSVFDNLAYGLRNRKVAAETIKQQIAETAEVLQITELLDRRPAQLSGGQRQRVAMGRAIVRKPKVFLFDEPLSNLDAKLRTHMRVEIKRLQRRQNVTSLFVTHDQVEAMTLGDRILLLNAGVIEQLGTPDELFYQPVSTYVASFIGSPAMNLLPATVSNQHVTIKDVQMPQPFTTTGADGEVIVGIRPQQLEVTEADQANLILEVDVVEPLGDLVLLHGKVGSGDEFTVQLPSRSHPVKTGDKVPLRADPDVLHFFDVNTGRRR